MTRTKLNIPIVMLHHVADRPHQSLQKWCISHSKFLELLNCIEQNNYQTTTFQEIITLKMSNKSLKDKIIITFDDCSAALFDFAIPELARRKMKAVFYMPSGYINGQNIWDIKEHAMTSVKLMNTDELKELIKLGMEVGSHGEKHIRLNKVDYAEAFREISNSKSTLENVLSTKIYSFAYPYGKIPSRYKQMLNEAGYKFGLAIYTAFETNYSLRRFAINETDDQKTINMKLSKKYRNMRLLYDPIFLLKNKLFKA